MRELRMAELRGSWLTWLAVSLTFIATGYAVTSALLLLRTALDAEAAGLLPMEEAAAMIFAPSTSLFFAALTALAVIGASTGLVVQARRPALARLALAGATPKQVVRLMLWQLALVSTGGAVLGSVLAIALLPATIGLEYADRGLDPVPASIDLPAILLATAVTVGLALLGGRRQARVASQIPAVESLREHDVPARQRRRVGRYLAAAVLLALALGLGASAIALAPGLGVDGGDLVMQAAVVAMLLLGTALALAAPVTVGLLTRAWTALVPSRSGTWMLARNTVIAKGERLARTVTPILFAVGLLIGMTMIGAGVDRGLRLRGDEGLSAVSMWAMLGLVGHALVIAIAGGIGAVIMMSRQREAELALAGISGATPRQQVTVTILEGIMISVTAILLGLVMSAFGAGVMYVGADRLGLPGAFALDVNGALLVTGFCLAVTIAATTLPVLSSLRRPAPVVIARLVAD